MNGSKKIIAIIFTLILATACGNAELESRKKLLDIATADKNHYEIIRNAQAVLEIDPENISAISGLRDSARVYNHIRQAAESLLKIEEPKFSDDMLKWDMDTANDDPRLIEYILKVFDDANITNEPTNDAERLKTINHYFAGYEKEESPEVVTDMLKAKIVLMEIGYTYGKILESFKDQVDYLSEAKSHLKKAERLDPRFKGVIELEDIIEERAKIFTMYAHVLFTLEFTDMATDAASYFDKVYAETNSQLDQFIDLGMSKYGYGAAEAYQLGKFEIDSGDWTRHLKFEIYKKNAQILLSLYKDLEDEFDDLDSLKPAINLVDSMISVFKYTEASGSIRDWNDLMTDSVNAYVRSSDELINEIDELEDIDEEKAEVNNLLNTILDEEITNIVDNSTFI